MYIKMYAFGGTLFEYTLGHTQQQQLILLKILEFFFIY